MKNNFEDKQSMYSHGQILELQMKNQIENQNVQKQRHGCVTTWLILIIIANSILSALYLFGSEDITDALAENIPEAMIVLLGILGAANAIFAVMLLKWKKLGFWGIAGLSIIGVIINLSLGLGLGNSLLGLVSLSILYGILQMKQGNATAWENLE